MNKIAIMQPYLFPYLGYWQLINSVDVFVIFDDVNYINRGWINRNNILVANKAHMFTIPVVNASQNRIISDCFFTSEMKIYHKFLKTLEQAYKKAPFFSEVFPLIERIVTFENKQISQMILNQFKVILGYLNITKEFVFSSEIDKDERLKNQSKIIEICNKLHADMYINAIGGKALYDFETFLKNNIILKFLNSKIYSYKQFSTEFVPNLSFIDVLMFNSSEAVKEALEHYDLIDKYEG